jgi:hypothetical protein
LFTFYYYYYYLIFNILKNIIIILGGGGNKWTEKSIAQKICLHFWARVIPLPKKMGMEGLCLETMEKDNNAQTLPMMPSLPK